VIPHDWLLCFCVTLLSPSHLTHTRTLILTPHTHSHPHSHPHPHLHSRSRSTHVTVTFSPLVPSPRPLFCTHVSFFIPLPAQQRWNRIPRVLNIIVECTAVITNFYAAIKASGVKSPTSRLTVTQSKVYDLKIPECTKLASEYMELMGFTKKQMLDFSGFTVRLHPFTPTTFVRQLVPSVRGGVDESLLLSEWSPAPVPLFAQYRPFCSG
jgi:hypothetical protein